MSAGHGSDTIDLNESKAVNQARKIGPFSGSGGGGSKGMPMQKQAASESI